MSRASRKHHNDLDKSFRLAEKDYGQQELILNIQWYPKVKNTETIRKRQIEIQTRIEELRNRVRREIRVKNDIEETKKLVEIRFAQFESNMEKSIQRLHVEELELKENIEKLKNIYSELEDNLNEKLTEIKTQDLDFAVIKILNQIEEPKLNICDPTVITITDVLTLDGRVVSSGKIIHSLMCLLQKFSDGDQMANKYYIELKRQFSEQYQKMLGLAVIQILNGTKNYWCSNQKAANLISLG